MVEKSVQGRLLVEDSRPVGSTRVSVLNLMFSKLARPRRMDWTSFHFRNCDFSEVLLHSAVFANCIFEGCNFEKAGLWESEIEDCEFQECNLREVALGGNDMFRPLKPNSFKANAFLKCDMRGSLHSTEHYKGCLFDCNNLSGVDFDGAIFEECKFIGKLDNVTFRSRSMLQPGDHANTLSGCSFVGSDVTWTQFIGISMKAEWFLGNDDVIFLQGGPQDWNRWFEVVDQSRLPGFRIFAEHLLLCGTPAIASKNYLAQCGFTAAEINALEEISKSEA